MNQRGDLQNQPKTQRARQDLTVSTSELCSKCANLREGDGWSTLEMKKQDSKKSSHRDLEVRKRGGY